MPRLSSQRALSRFAAAVGTLYDSAAANTPEELAQSSARAVAEMIPCENSSYNHLVTTNGSARAALGIAFHPAPPPPELLPPFEAHMEEHVSFRVVQERGIRDAVLLSDFISNREFRRTAFYQEYYRHRGTRFQLGFAFPASKTSTITVALNRWLCDFSSDDRALLTLLRPHFQRAYDLALARWLRQEKESEGAAPPASDIGGNRSREAWLRITPEGRLRDCPAPLRGREEEAVAGRPGALRALGLTPRQADVLLWIAHGKTNEEIGVILGASRNTVHHHVEAILARLGVVSRAEATLRALEALGWLRWPRG